jgi:hypothetical protein
LYRITDGKLYSSGFKNGYVQMTKKGRVFTTIGALKNHIGWGAANGFCVGGISFKEYLDYSVVDVYGSILGKVKDYYKE